MSTVSKLDPSVRRSRYERRNLLRYFERIGFTDGAHLMRALIADERMPGTKKHTLTSAIARTFTKAATHDSTFDSIPI